MLLSADKIHDGRKWLPDGSLIEVADDGTITAIHAQAPKDAPIVHYNGVLCPGFVNTHCHLELSHMRGVIPEHTGLIPFLQQVFRNRGNHTEQQKKAARYQAYEELIKNGVVAVGDISNMNDTSDIREAGKLHFHTFVEAIGFNETPQKQFDNAVAVYHSFAAQKPSGKRLTQSITPHAPYSVSHVMFSLIDKHQPQSLLSIHNQESAAEDEYYLLKQGDVQTLLHGIGIDDTFFTPSGKSSLQTYLQWLSREHTFLFVHNTYTKRADIQVAQTLLPELFWCLCPNANLYIENRLPDVPMFMEEHVNLCVGTDSLSSNHRLSILHELQTIKQAYPAIQWEQLLQWGTYNGAAALHMQDIIGSFEPGKQPGILHITGLDSDREPQVNVVL